MLPMKAPDLFRRPARPKYTGLRQRFSVLPFTNERTGSLSWRVGGIRRDGTRVRENHTDPEMARLRCLELETAFHNAENLEPAALRATKLPADALRLCEAAVARLEKPEDILVAVDHWLRVGRQQPAVTAPRLDDAAEQFVAWLESAPALRPSTRKNLRSRVGIFVGSTGNMRISEITADTVENFLAARPVSSVTRDNDRRALSGFFTWCAARPRRWLSANPCHMVTVAHRPRPEPVILTVDQCGALLRAARDFQLGRLAPYVAVCVFGGLRPTEAARLDWAQVNLVDSEIRLEAAQTKTGRARVVTICPTLAAWLRAFDGFPFYPPSWRDDFDAIRAAAGITSWPPDVMRHTAISHYFRQCGSYGLTAEQFGNSEAVIKDRYQGRVSSADTARFYALTPDALL
jgi:integrase